MIACIHSQTRAMDQACHRPLPTPPLPAVRFRANPDASPRMPSRGYRSGPHGTVFRLSRSAARVMRDVWPTRVWFFTNAAERRVLCPTILSDQPMIVSDATLDERFACNPLVTGPKHIKFYAGAPLISHDGVRLGAFCILDRKPRFDISGTEIDRLISFAGIASKRLEKHRTSRTGRILNSFSEATGVALVTCDGEGLITYWNAAASKLFGYGASETIGRPLADHADPLPGGTCGRPLAPVSLAERGVRVGAVRLATTVHGVGDRMFMAALAALARGTGVSAYIGERINRWPAVHVGDVGRLYRLILEAGSPARAYHANAEEGVPFRQIAEPIGRNLGLPVEPAPATISVGWQGSRPLTPRQPAMRRVASPDGSPPDQPCWRTWRTRITSKRLSRELFSGSLPHPRRFPETPWCWETVLWRQVSSLV